MTTDRPPHRRLTDSAVAGLIFVGSLAVLLATTDIGFTRDEGFYFRAASLYVGWFEELWANLQAGDLAASFSRESIDQHWSYNPEHPVLMKAAFALSHLLFHDGLGVMSSSTAWRFPAMVTASALLVGVYLFTRDLAGRLAGIVAVAALLFQPRFFFHAHLAVFDVPITAFWFWVCYAYWRSYESKRWALTTGILFGLALSVKLNAFFLPIVLVGHWALNRWRQFRVDLQAGTVSLPAIPKAFWSMLVFGPMLFYALWPRHWFDTFERVRWYMEFHLEHEHYLVHYFGESLQVPPFPISYPWVMTLVTVPLVILVACSIGAVTYFWRSGQWTRLKETFRAFRQRRWPDGAPADPRGTGLLVAINVIFPIALISMPDTPIFGGTKHWMPAMPFVAILAGFGVVTTIRGLRPIAERYTGRARKVAMAVVATLLAGCVIVPSMWATATNHPFGTSYYNALVGGERGAADRKMMRQYWGYASRHALPWLNEQAPQNSAVYTHNTIGMAWEAYQNEQLARTDLRATSRGGSDYALYHQQKAFKYQLLPLWEDYGTMAPAYVVDHEGVPMLSVYVRADGDYETLKHPHVWR